jgi:Flp pilus assembly protein, ATPase CpaF
MTATTATDVPWVDESLVAEMRARISDALIARNASLVVRLSNDDERMYAVELANRELESLAATALAQGTPPLSPDGEHAILRAVLDRLFELGRLQPLLDDDQVLNITANGCDRVFVDRADGTKHAGPPIAESDEELIELLREIGRRHGLSEREFNPGRPSLNLQLPDGSRLFAVAWVCDRPALAIRRHRHMRVTLADLTRLETVSEPLAAFLGAAVRARLQIIVAGATGAGKTTLLRALAAEIPPVERIVTIETELELGLDRYPDLHPDVVALEARTANVEGVGQVSAADLVRMSLRMNPDRVIVGEVRGDEIIPMLNAMSAGNDGSLCTLHADSSATVFNKLGLYAMQAPERLDLAATNQLAAAAIDLIVFITRTAQGRSVASVRQVVGADGRQVITNELFAPGPDGRAIPAVPIPHDLAELLADHGRHPRIDHMAGRRP